MAQKKSLPPSAEAQRPLIEPGHPAVERAAAVRAAGAEPVELLLRAGRGDGGEPAADAADRRAVHGPPVLRQPADDGAGWSSKGEEVNRKRVQRLMRLMGLEAIYPKPKLTCGRAGAHRIYPYLLRDVTIERPDQVWSTDITYVPMPTGFMYLAAVIDWYSRYVLAWRLSNTLDGSFCLEMLEEALEPRAAGGVQHRPGGAVHGRGVHGAAGVGRGGGEHGRARAGAWTTCSWSGCGGR